MIMRMVAHGVIKDFHINDGFLGLDHFPQYLRRQITIWTMEWMAIAIGKWDADDWLHLAEHLRGSPAMRYRAQASLPPGRWTHDCQTFPAFRSIWQKGKITNWEQSTFGKVKRSEIFCSWPIFILRGSVRCLNNHHPCHQHHHRRHTHHHNHQVAEFHQETECTNVPKKSCVTSPRFCC